MGAIKSISRKIATVEKAKTALERHYGTVEVCNTPQKGVFDLHHKNGDADHILTIFTHECIPQQKP